MKLLVKLLDVTKFALVGMVLGTLAVGCNAVSKEELAALKQELRDEQEALRQDFAAETKKMEQAGQAVKTEVTAHSTATRGYAQVEVEKLREDYRRMTDTVEHFGRLTTNIEAIQAENHKLYAQIKAMLERQLDVVTYDKNETDKRKAILSFLESTLRTTIKDLNDLIPNQD